MSVLIKTMEMPKNCGECQFCHTGYFKQWCCPTGREDFFCDAIPEWCPLEEPKTGEWTNVGVLTVRCSNCKSEFHELEAMNFCPNCGVKMVREDGEEE